MRKGLFSTGATRLTDIFLAPLEAVIQADIDLSERITKFIMDYGFDDWDQKGKLPKLKMVSFSFTNEQGKVEVFSLPVLSLIQLPLLRIKDANFDMKVKMITVDIDEEESPPSLLDDDKTVKLPQRQSAIKAFLTPSTSSNMETMKSNMKVRLNMIDGDMPGGIIQLLAMMGEINNVNDKRINNVKELEL
ncbi:DUF2589 domain-containing protein [Flavobacterium daemonense]|uniref:DUF2589 domain-containing protein n=1 Tax=Flavobacterium daemonense TaxID=1393049 RepID=UPI001186112E|nr:DUF2589 domain-containing protein [Flavobacterium daemonense]KAF2325791.1 DUF2589 domain-containing protein [Flavobacterium daemonense]